MFKNSGQVCINAKRMYIHADIYDAMRDALVARAARARIGNGADPETELGPLQNATQFRKLQCVRHDFV
jgi:acyl-CoA reductase-like NAD-dependent aldehyde dehydrogenase